MPKRKERFFPSMEKQDDKIVASFGVPKGTLLTWKKAQTDESNYRGGLYDKMSIITKLEENALNKFKALFTQKEFMALWGSLNGTMYQMHLIEQPDILANNFRDYCHYDAMEAQQFTEDELPLFAQRVGDKLNSLGEFEKYVLLDFIKSESGEGHIFQKNQP